MSMPAAEVKNHALAGRTRMHASWPGFDRP
jgi:hypothetical protein